MLTSSIEYKTLVNRVAMFLSIDKKNIYSIVNPLRRKQRSSYIWQVVIKNSSNVLLRDNGNELNKI